MKSPNKNPNQSWTQMVAASRNESPAPVDVRYGVRAGLERMLRIPKTDELDWVDALINLFSPNLVKLGMGAALICMLTVTAITPTETEAIAEFEDPLVTLYPDQTEWSDWL